MAVFKDFSYRRPDMEHLKKDFDNMLNRFDRADSAEAQTRVMEEINGLRNDFETMESLVHIRHTIDTADLFYEKENDYIDEVKPLYDELVDRYYRSLAGSAYRRELEAKWGAQLFRIAELKLSTFTPEIITDLQQENKFASQYTKLRASAKILFEGEERNLAQMTPFMESPDRKIRKSAQEAFSGFFEENEAQFDAIYANLVKVRDGIARKLGFKNFVALGYARLSRSDYDAAMVAGYRKQVLETLVPLATELRRRQSRRLGLDALQYYDEPLEFLSGNAVPKGDSAWILENGKRMYRELSPETDEFFTYMLEKELMDLTAKKGKAGGGYCTYLNNYQAPFIFANFNGTSGDVDVLTHEAGHAFQIYSSRNFKIPEYYWPTMEACEIHSMSMEFLTWPWMDLFFQTDVEKYRFSHLSGSLLFIPYGVTVDEFQHWVYENPGADPAARKRTWREIERKYLPHRDYADNGFLERGGYWLRQGHIFDVPFYYIDYTLAQVCAFQFWQKSRENRAETWSDYLRLCRAGGSLPFLELVKLAGLKNPFEPGSLQATLGPIRQWLDAVDDSKL
jgi:M3 family oligoendopeptidase